MKLGLTTPPPAANTNTATAAAAAPDEPLKQQQQSKKGRIWYLGSVLFVFGNIVNFISFSFAAQALLSAIGSAQFVSNVFFSSVLLGEAVTRRTVYATGAILIGNVLVVMSFAAQSHSSHSNHQEEKVWTAHDVMHNFDAAYFRFLTGLASLFVFCKILFHRIKVVVDKHSYHHNAAVNVAGNGNSASMNMYANRVMPTAYAAYSAILGSQSVLMAKCLSILLRSGVLRDDDNNNDKDVVDYEEANKAAATAELFIDEIYITQLFFLAWLLTMSFWLRQMNKALAQFDGLFIIPTLQVFWTFFSILSGGVFFKEFEKFDVGQGIGFTIGIVIVFYGVVLLSSANTSAGGKKVTPVKTIEVRNQNQESYPSLV